MQLSQPEALGTFDDHHRCIGDVDAHFDDGGCYHDVARSICKTLHLHVLGLGLHSAVDDSNAEIREREPPRKALVAVHQVLVIQGGAFLNQRIDDVHLAPALDFVFHELEHRQPRLIGAVHGFDRLATGRHLIDDADVQVAVRGHGQRPRNGRSGHHQHVRCWVGLGPELAALRHAKSVLLIDNSESQTFELDAGFDEGMGPD